MPFGLQDHCSCNELHLSHQLTYTDCAEGEPGSGERRNKPKHINRLYLLRPYCCPKIWENCSSSSFYITHLRKQSPQTVHLQGFLYSPTNYKCPKAWYSHLHLYRQHWWGGCTSTSTNCRRSSTCCWNILFQLKAFVQIMYIWYVFPRLCILYFK